MFERLKALFHSPPPLPPDEPEAGGFAQARQTFNLFLTAWNSFQDTLSNVEYALCCERPFDMTRVRALGTAVVTRSLQCIQLLSRLEPNHNLAPLRERFHTLTEELTPLLETTNSCLLGQSVIRLDSSASLEASDAAYHTGMPNLVDKAVFQLLRLRDALGGEYPDLVPPCFVVTAAGAQRALRTRGLHEDISGYIQKTGGVTPRSVYKMAAHIRGMILKGTLPASVADPYLEEIRHLRSRMGGQPGLLLLRGRVWQDSAEHDDGMVMWGPETDLYAPDDILLDALRLTLAHNFSAPSMVYRRWRGIRDTEPTLCVLAMAVPPVSVSGLVHTMNPMRTGRSIVHVYGWHGLPGAADETAQGDDTTLNLDNAATIDSAGDVDEFHMLRRMPHAVAVQSVADMDKPCLDAGLALQLTELALKAEKAENGTALSLNWILRPDGKVSLVMSRPMILGDHLEPEITQAENLPTPLINWGLTASAGVACGPVNLVRGEQDAKNFTDGAILVVERDARIWASLLDRAAGVIVGKGFLGSRLASICREFGKPALFNVPNCMDALENDTIVTLCADSGSVYAGAVDSLLEHAHKPHDFLLNSSVYHALSAVAAKVAPLTMLPDTPDFRAANCQTFHDIARYCNERAVSAIFELGSDQKRAPERTKQLYDGTLKQFWIIDLDQAFDPAAANHKVIDVKSVNSPPFQALWHGMNVLPWEGPPPIDNKGFMSILYEATANPNLEPAAQGAYFSEKNYFMVSRDYCSLYSRFGFHFVSVGGRVTPRRSNNALSFQLRGGAANVERRILRVRLVADILWECGLEPLILHDAVRARVSNIDAENALAVLNALGYLTIHTRQLDMIMADRAQVNARAGAMLKHCKALLFNPQVAMAGLAAPGI